MGGKGSGRRGDVFDLSKLPDPDRLPYERQPNDTDMSWNAFLKYRNLGPERSLAKVVEELEKEPRYISQIEVWSAKYRWRARVVDWDREIDRQSRRARLSAAARVSNEMATVAESMWKLAARDLAKWHEKLEAVRGSTPLLSPSDLQKLTDTGMKLHRLALGEASEIRDVNVGGPGIIAKVVFVDPEEEDEDLDEDRDEDSYEDYDDSDES